MDNHLKALAGPIASPRILTIESDNKTLPWEDDSRLDWLLNAAKTSGLSPLIAF